MALEKFTIQSLRELDGGRVAEAFDQAVKRCHLDCMDRPALEGGRKVALVATFKPILDGEGDLDSVDVQFEIKEAIPARKSKAYNMRAERGGLFFNELSPDDARQMTLDEVTGPRPLAAGE